MTDEPADKSKAAQDGFGGTDLEKAVYERLGHVIDPELGKSITDLRMVTAIDAQLRTEDSGFTVPVQAKEGEPIYDVVVNLELTVAGCPLTQHLLGGISDAVTSYPDAMLIPKVNVSSMSQEKLSGLVADLKAARHQNPFSNPQSKTKIFAVVSGKGELGSPL